LNDGRETDQEMQDSGSKERLIYKQKQENVCPIAKKWQEEQESLQVGRGSSIYGVEVSTGLQTNDFRQSEKDNFFLIYFVQI
jgi:hypothetical protein